jgi:hypothetical protein
MRGYVAAAALAVATVLAAPAYADHERYVTLTGTGGGYADVTLARDTLVDPRLSSFRGTGAVTGYYVRALGGTDDAVGLVVRDVKGVAGMPTTLPAGRYRFYLVADGRASVRVYTEGGLRGHVTPRLRTAPFAASSGRIAVTREVTSRWAGERTARIRRNGSLVLTVHAARFEQGDVPTWGAVVECRTKNEGPCEGADTDGYTPVGPAGTGSVVGWATYPVGAMAAGDVLHQRYRGTAEPLAVGAVVELTP